MKARGLSIVLLACIALASFTAAARAQSVSVDIHIHRIQGAELQKLKALLAPIRQERTDLTTKHYSTTNRVTDAYRKKREGLQAKEDSAKRGFLATRKPDVADGFTILFGVPFEKELRFDGENLVFAGESQPSSSLYWPSPDHSPAVIPCRFKITYGDRLLRSSWNPGALDMGTWIMQLKRSGEERVYLVIRKRFVKTANKAIDGD